MAFFEIILKLSFINSTVAKYPLPSSFSHSVGKVTFVIATVGPIVSSLPIRLTLLVRANILISV